MSIDEYNYLWDGSSSEWVLFRTNEAESAEPEYIPANIVTRQAFLIEDDAVFAAVVARMLDQGCRVITAKDWSAR